VSSGSQKARFRVPPPGAAVVPAPESVFFAAGEGFVKKKAARREPGRR